jgi:hypothetical protein
MVVEKDKVSFHPEQLKYLQKVFPTVVFPPSATKEEMLYYNGQQSIIEFIKGRLR